MAPMRTHANSWNEFQVYSQHVKQPLKTTTLSRLGFLCPFLDETLEDMQRTVSMSAAKVHNQNVIAALQLP